MPWRLSWSTGSPTPRTTTTDELTTRPHSERRPRPWRRHAYPVVAMSTPDYRLTQLDVLEAEAIHLLREVAAEFERPVLLFSGGKDSVVMLHVALKAFWPAKLPFPVMHVDTGHNFTEVIEFRDSSVARLGVKLVVASVQESIDRGRAVEESGPRASRN